MSLYQKALRRYESAFFGFIPVGVIVQSCLGSIAAMYILQKGTDPVQMFQLFIVVMTCMGYNGAVLSNQKPKIVLNMLILSLVTNTILTAINLIF